MAASAATTRTAGLGAMALTIPFIGNAVENLVLLRGDAAEAGAHEGGALIGVPLDSYGNVLAFGALVMLGLSAWSLLLGAAILLRRPWARDAGFATFGLFALALPIGLVGMFGEPPAPDAWQGVLIGVANIAIVVLLARETTGTDFELAARDRHLAPRKKKDRRHMAAGPS